MAASLYVAGAALVSEDGTRIWYDDNTAAMAAYSTQVHHIQAGPGTLHLSGQNCVVDLAGQAVTITDSGSVTCFDSANDAYESWGSAVIDGVTLSNNPATIVNGKTYCTLSDGSAYSFHKLGMRVSGVSVRPSAAGIYYNGTWQLDDLLKGKVRSYGIAVSLTDMPTAEFDADTLWTEFAPDTLESGKSQTSVLIENILKTGAEDNDARGKDKIYAAAYVVLDDGTEGGCKVVTDTLIAYSLYDVMKLLDDNAYAANQEALEAFYASWEDPMSA